MQTPQYDYIVIGAGSAGCVVAARLAQDASVLLLEAGEAAESHPETLSADGFKYAFANDALMIHRMTEPQAALGKRRLYIGSGRGMGGSGAVNGMVYTRGDKADFLKWPQGWQWEDCLPAFENVEQQLGIQPRPTTAFADTWLAAAQTAGFQRKDHLNDGDLCGYAGCNDINYAGHERRSSYRSWLHEKPLPGLQILTSARTQRVLFDEQGCACAVQYQHEQHIKQAVASREIILCAGALETPKLLMLSGIGPAKHLQTMGIDVVQDAPGVGQNLQDHPNVCLFYRAKQLVDFQYPQLYGFDAARRPKGAKQAPDTCFVAYAAPASIEQSMLRMLPILALPGRLYEFRFLRQLLRSLIGLSFKLPPIRHFVSRVFGMVVILGKPDSRGHLHLRSADPEDPPVIDPAYFTQGRDRETLLAGIEIANQIVRQPALSGSRSLSAGAKAVNENKRWRWAAKAMMTTFHYCGTCRMGNDPNSPVDPRLRVRGIRNLRIADASVIPEIPVSALNAPTMMIAYRAVDFILADRMETHRNRDAA